MRPGSLRESGRTVSDDNNICPAHAQELGSDESFQADAAALPASGRRGSLQGPTASAGLCMRHAGSNATGRAPDSADAPAGGSIDARGHAATPVHSASAGSLEEAATPWPPAGLGSVGSGPFKTRSAERPAWSTPAGMGLPVLPAATTAVRAGAGHGAPGKGGVSSGTTSEALRAPGPPGSVDPSALAQAWLAQLATAAGILAGQAGVGPSPAAPGQATTPMQQQPSVQAQQWRGFAVGASPSSACCPGALHPCAYPAVYPAAPAHWPWPGCMAPALPWVAPGLGTPEALRQPQAVAPEAQLPADSAALVAVLQSLLHALNAGAAASPALAAAQPAEAPSPAAASPAAAASLSLQALLRALTPAEGSPAPATDAFAQPPSEHKPGAETLPEPVPGYGPSPDPGGEQARRATLRASAAGRHAHALRSIQSLIRQPHGAHAQAPSGLGAGRTSVSPTAGQRSGQGRDSHKSDTAPASEPRRYAAFPGAPAAGAGSGGVRSAFVELPRSRSDASAQTSADLRDSGDYSCAYTPGQTLGGSGGPGSVSVKTRGAYTQARLQPGPGTARDPDPGPPEGHLAGLARRALARSLSSEHGWPEAGGRAASPGVDAAVAPAERAHQQPGADKRPVDVHFNPLFHSGEGEEGLEGSSGAGPGVRRGATHDSREARQASCGSGQESWRGPAAGATPLSDALAAADVSEPLRCELLGLLARNLTEVQVRSKEGAAWLCRRHRHHATLGCQAGSTRVLILFALGGNAGLDPGPCARMLLRRAVPLCTNVILLAAALLPLGCKSGARGLSTCCLGAGCTGRGRRRAGALLVSCQARHGAGAWGQGWAPRGWQPAPRRAHRGPAGIQGAAAGVLLDGARASQAAMSCTVSLLHWEILDEPCVGTHLCMLTTCLYCSPVEVCLPGSATPLACVIPVVWSKNKLVWFMRETFLASVT